MVPPRRFSDISDISHTERPKRRRLLDKNVHFDQMIQSMSAVNRDSHQRQRNDAYSPSRSTTLTSNRSFIKNTAAKVLPENARTTTTKS